MAPTAQLSSIPRSRPATKQNAALKRKSLHSIIQRLTEGCVQTNETTDVEYSRPEEKEQLSAKRRNETDTDEGSMSPGCSSSTDDYNEFRLIKKKVERVPKRMSQLSVSSISELIIPINYHEKMARSFSEAENRSPMEQTKRDRNTIAARESRAKMRAMHSLLNKEAADEQTQNRNQKLGLATSFVYASMLLERLDMPSVNFLQIWDQALEQLESVAVQGSAKK